MSQEDQNPELTAVEAALATLAPALGRLDRDQLLFRAGQASVSRRRWLWPGTTSVLAAVAASLAIALVLRPSPQAIATVAYVPVQNSDSQPDLARVATDPVESSWPRANEADRVQTRFSLLENQLVRWGLDGLGTPPQATAPSGPPLTMDDLLGTSPAARPAPSWFPFESLLKLGDRS